MTRNHVRSARDHHLVDIPANKHVAVTVLRRHRNATRSRSNHWAIVSSWPRKRSPNQGFFSPTRGERPGHIDGPVGPLGFFGLAQAAFIGKVFTNATASSSHALSALFVGTGGSI
jgi:hypothetical protein